MGHLVRDGRRADPSSVRDGFSFGVSSCQCAPAVAAGHAELHEREQLLHGRKVRGVAGAHVLDPAAADTARDVRFRPKLNSESAPGERELIGWRSHADTAKSTRMRAKLLDEYGLILTAYEPLAPRA